MKLPVKKYFLNTMVYRIFGLKFSPMKITALIPEELVQDVKKYSGGKNITESLMIALNDYISRQKIKKSIQKIKKNPLEFASDFTADQVRKLNREG